MALWGIPGDTAEYVYTGTMQSVTIQADGIYKLECWGPGGGYGGGTGGYSCGYKLLKKDTLLYICVGQSGGDKEDHGSRYNGGQDGSGSSNPACWYGKHPGAGCTHMALMDGVLASLSENKDQVLIVAGGAGAAATDSTYGGTGSGGDGGGLSGTAGGSGAGGTQTSGYGFGLGGAALAIGTDGTSNTACCGGGAGWYGGYAGIKGGGAGSGYIDGVPEFTYLGTTYSPSTTTGGGCATTDNGKARITHVANALLTAYFNGTQLGKIIFNGTEITGLVVDGTTLF